MLTKQRVELIVKRPSIATEREVRALAILFSLSSYPENSERLLQLLSTEAPVNAGVPERGARDDLLDAANTFLQVLDEHPDQLVPVNRNSAVVRALRSSVEP